MNSLDNKVALVTGGGTGIGKATAQLLADRGAKVVVAGRREGPLLDTAASRPSAISAVTMDLSISEDRVRAVDTVIERHGRLDILINNGGAQHVGSFMETDDAMIEKIVSTNVIGNALLTKCAIPHLQKTKGNVVMISSCGATYYGQPPGGMTIYGASKGALNHLTRLLAAELGLVGIRVNAVAPGATHAETADVGLAMPGVAEWLAAQTPLDGGRVGDPIDIARMIVFLASDEAAWVTGQVVQANGGMHLAI